MLVGLEKGDDTWMITVYQRDSSSLYQLSQSFNVLPMDLINFQYTASIELSADGMLMMLSGLQDCKMRVYEFIETRFVLTT